jgi:hypothetical protein
MAVVAVANRLYVSPPNEMEITHRNYRVATQILQGQVGVWNASGFIIPTGTAPAADVPVAGIAMLRGDPSMSVEMFQEGFLAGYTVSGLALYDYLYAGGSGNVETTGNVIIGQVLPYSYSGEKMAYFDFTRSWLLNAV